ncbi:DinB family protein [Kribbella qitaiheensis]|uniref:DinB family protein n=1 Tax=Kribbella qitaiheensis TaxID=1544730 RepID=A0A7G6X2C6_9ACTN|nr:DinB family protein [Kribbella qitaiheensis]QNE20391.1 DinB family protein [Kribbella qitaiheensis]
MDDDLAKKFLHGELQDLRKAVLWKLEGLSEYDVRRPLTSSGTNLLGLVKHLALWESRYFGEVFGRPSPEAQPRWDDLSHRGADMWATEDETREEIVDRYRRVWEHSDATIAGLNFDSPGHAAWWPNPDVRLFNIMVHMLSETSRHAGHADILREQLDGSVGTIAARAKSQPDEASREAQRTEIERVAKAVAAD